MSAVRILVLGVVHAQGRAHGYQVRRELLSWRADAWASAAPGSIYQALRTLSKRGLLSPVTTEAGGGGPERTVYEVTPDGETELLHLVRVALTEADGDALNAAFAFLHLLGRLETIDLLHHRVRGLWARLAEVEAPPNAPPQPDDGTPPQVAALLQRSAGMIRTDIAWALDLAERVRAGAFQFSDDQSSQA